MRGDASAINHNYEIACRCECREISSRESSSSEILRSLRKNVTSRYDKSSTCHAQIQFYEARSRRMEVHRQRRGTPRNTPVWSQAWRRLNSTGSASFWRLSQATLAVLGWRKGGVCRRTREGGFGYPLENGERIEVAMGTKSGWIPCFDLPTTRAPRRARVL